jgi:dienelactone hydrolase
MAALFVASVVVPAAASAMPVSPQAFAAAEVAHYQTAGIQPPPGVDTDCIGPNAPKDDPAPGTPAWQQRDTLNQYCSTLRLRDQIESPAFGHANLTQGGALWAQQMMDQLGDPGHLRGGITTLIPGSRAADPFRTIGRWTAAGRGRVAPVSFSALDGAILRGHIFEPPASDPPPPGGYPGVVITDGSVQAYQELYYWAAEDLASAGYVVMTYDVQGQGTSDLLPAGCPDPSNPTGATSCQGVPYQQNYNFYQGAEDSLSFFLSTPDRPFGGSHNPAYADLNPNEVGIAGHSLGAAAVSEVGQCDNRVKAIVAWDDLGKISGCTDVTIPAPYKGSTLIHAPALGLTNDYGFNPEPGNPSSPPDPRAKEAGYKQVAAAGLDSASIALRGATHLTYSYIPLVLPASELAERMASYYTIAWFDRFLRGEQSGYDRLTATTFDNSVDVHSIGAGTFDPQAALANPSDPEAGNVPYKIAGIPVQNAASFYYLSQYRLTDPSTGAVHACGDMRAGCGG